jgi:hypothetical protein
MASEELATVHELLRGVDFGDLTIAERRAAFDSLAAPPPPGTTVEPVDAGGVPAEWVVAAGVESARVLLYLHGGAYQAGSPGRRKGTCAPPSAPGRVPHRPAGPRRSPTAARRSKHRRRQPADLNRRGAAGPDEAPLRGRPLRPDQERQAAEVHPPERNIARRIAENLHTRVARARQVYWLVARHGSMVGRTADLTPVLFRPPRLGLR